MFEVHEINQIEALGGCRTAWRQLLDETPHASFFQSLEWLECYWRYFAVEQKLRVLVISAGGRPVGIVPLVVRPETTRVGRVRVLTYPLHDWGSFYGPIGSDAAAILTAGMQHVRRTPRDWDLLDLRWIDADAADHGCTTSAMTAAGLRPCRQKWNETSLVELPETWQAYWSARDTRFRKNIDRLQQRMAAQGKVEFVRYRHSNPKRKRGSLLRDGEANELPRWDLYDACVALAARSWQGDRGDKTSLCHEQFGEFFRTAHAAAAELSAADISLLYFDGEPAAFAYCYCWKGAVYGLRKGFDPRFAPLRPGLVLQKLMLEDGHRRGDRLYDLGSGDDRTKAPWRTSVRTSYRYTFFPATVLRAQLLWWNRWLRQQFRGERDIACTT